MDVLSALPATTSINRQGVGVLALQHGLKCPPNGTARMPCVRELSYACTCFSFVVFCSLDLGSAESSVSRFSCESLWRVPLPFRRAPSKALVVIKKKKKKNTKFFELKYWK